MFHIFFSRNVNIALQAIILDNGKYSQKFETKIHHFKNNLFYLLIFRKRLPHSVYVKPLDSYHNMKQVFSVISRKWEIFEDYSV